VANTVLEEPGVLDQGWEKTAEALLERAYREAGLEPPDWIHKRTQAEDDVYEDVKEAIRSFLLKRISEAYFRAVGSRVVVQKDDGFEYRDSIELGLEEKVKIALGSGLIPWASLKKGEGEDLIVVFTAEFARDLEPVIGNIGGLKSIAELLGWEYKHAKLGGGRQGKVAAVKLSELLDFLKL